MKPINTFLEKRAEDMRVLEATRQVVGYLYKDEQKHYQESEPKDRREHIFKSVKILDKFVKEQTAKLVHELLRSI
jgi:hypothetical protein